MDSAGVLALYQQATTHTWLAALVVFVAQWGVFLLPLALVGMWVRASSPHDQRREAIVVGVVAAALAFALGLVLERTIGRSRPFVALGFMPLLPHVADSSFPSDHTLVGVALVGPLLGRTSKPATLLVGWALVVGTARVVAGLHYPSDILGSGLLALLLDAAVWAAMRPALTRLGLQRSVPPL